MDKKFLPVSLLSASALLLLSTTNHPFYCGPPATAESANVAIWAGTESTPDFSLCPERQMPSSQIVCMVVCLCDSKKVKEGNKLKRYCRNNTIKACNFTQRGNEYQVMIVVV